MAKKQSPANSTVNQRKPQSDASTRTTGGDAPTSGKAPSRKGARRGGAGRQRSTAKSGIR